MFKVIQEIPSAHATIKGSEAYESIQGNVYLYEVYGGTVLMGEIYGIPPELEERAAASTASIFMKEAGVREVLRMNLRMLRAITIPKGYPIPGMRVIFRR